MTKTGFAVKRKICERKLKNVCSTKFLQNVRNQYLNRNRRGHLFDSSDRKQAKIRATVF